MAGVRTSATERLPLPNVCTVSTQAAAAPEVVRQQMQMAETCEVTRYSNGFEISKGNLAAFDTALSQIFQRKLLRSPSRSVQGPYSLCSDIIEQAECVTSG